MRSEERKPRLASLIRAVDLLPAASRPIKSFSTGMTTRLGIAASLMNDPSFLIWDEPTAGLDPAGRKYTLDLLRELGKTKTIMVSSHILSDIDRVCDHAGIIHDGKLIFCGSVRALKETIGRNSVEIELDGEETVLDAFCLRLGSVLEIVGFERKGAYLDVRFAVSERIAAPLGRLLLLAAEMGVEILSISSTRGQTEDAFIHLLEADQAHGFSRAFGRFRRPLMASSALFKAELLALSRSWVLRGWLIALALTEFFVLSLSLLQNRAKPTLASGVLAAHLNGFLLVWSIVIIVLGAGSVSMESDVISDSILSRRLHAHPVHRRKIALTVHASYSGSICSPR